VFFLSGLQFSRGAEEEGTFSEFDKGTRNMQLLWTNIQPSSISLDKIIPLVLSDDSSSLSAHSLSCFVSLCFCVLTYFLCELPV